MPSGRAEKITETSELPILMDFPQQCYLTAVTDKSSIDTTDNFQQLCILKRHELSGQNAKIASATRKGLYGRAVPIYFRVAGRVGCSTPIPQRHAHHHIIRRDVWGRGRLEARSYGFSVV